MMNGRLTVNIISSEMPGEVLESALRYRRTRETMIALRQLLDSDHATIRGNYVQVDLESPRISRDTRIYTPFYFGGLSEDARQVAAECCDVYLMWPDTREEISRLINDMSARATSFNRQLLFGFRVHVVVRDTETEARAAAAHLIAAVDDETGDAIRARSLDSQSVGVRRQAELRRDATDDGFIDGILWTGIGKARSGCGAALVGTPTQVAEAMNEYRRLGIDSFILSGYPHQDECARFARDVLPLIDHGPLQFADRNRA
jgi:alkanesulfonate monooxygenase